MKKILILICFLCVSSVAYAQNIVTYKLDNGQTLIVEQIKSNPIVIVDTWINTGSRNEDDSNSGISHFLEHLFFKGTAKHPTGDFDKILESKGAITNAATSKDFTHYYIKISSQYFDEALALHADMLLNPQIPRKEMEKERKVVLEEISKDANSPSNICYENLNKLLYSHHPYKRKVIGNAKIIETVSREAILDYYKKYYTPSNMTTIVIGDVEPEHVLKVVKENFNVEPRKAVSKKYRKEAFLNSQKRTVTYMPSQSGYMMIGFRGADISDNDTYALDVLATVLGSSRSSRLYQSIKEQKQLVNSISSSNATMKDDGIFVVNSNFVPQNSQKVENAIFTEINKIKEFGISDSDLKIAKKIIETDTYYSRESVSNIAKELGYISILTGGTDYYKNYLSKINKVSISDVKRVANKYLNINNSAISIVLPENYIAKPVVDTPENHTAKLVSTNKLTAKYLLDNNATLLITDNNYNDIVAVTILAKGGNFYETKRGISNLFADLLLKGTKQYSAVELAQLLEENGINISFSPGSDTFNINILTTKKQLEYTLDLLCDILNNSSFDDIEIEKGRTVLLNKLKQSKDNPLNIAVDNYKSLIYGNSVYSKSNALLEKSVPLITREDILTYQKRIFNPNDIVISVNGNVDKDVLINKFGQMFTKKNIDTKFDFKNYSIPEIKNKTYIEKDLKEQKTAWLLFGWRTCGITNVRECATLQVINTILGSGMSSRLFKSIREQEGLAYQVGSSFNPNVLAGALLVYVGTNPSSKNHVESKILSEMEKLKTQFVSEKELQDAKDRLLGEFVIALETNSDKAETLGSFEISGRGYNFIEDYKKIIQSVTVSDIVEIANKYINCNYIESVVTTK